MAGILGGSFHDLDTWLITMVGKSPKVWVDLVIITPLTNHLLNGMILQVHPGKLKMEPENRPLEEEIPIQKTHHFQVPAVSFRGVYTLENQDGS